MIYVCLFLIQIAMHIENMQKNQSDQTILPEFGTGFSFDSV